MSSRSKRGRRRNRGRFSLLFKLLAGAALVAALTFGATVFFQVEHILIAGNSRYTAQEVEEASGIQLGDNLFRLNKGQISEDIRRKLPYVEELTIVWHLPSTIAIEIREWDAVASILPSSGTSTAEAPAAEEAEDTELPEETGTAAGEAWLISVGGRLLEPAPEDSTALTVTGLTVLSPQAGTQMAVPQGEETRRQGPARCPGGAGDPGEGVLHRPVCGDGDPPALRRPVRCEAAHQRRFYSQAAGTGGGGGEAGEL